MMEDEEEYDFVKLKPLEYFGTSYARENLFKPKDIDVSYSPGMLALGTKIRNGQPAGTYYLDLREACRIICIGATRCMPKDTKVLTSSGYKNIQDVDEVRTYNFDKKICENKKCVVHNSGKLKVVKIYTKYGVVKCSENHKWFLYKNGKLDVVETKNLTTKNYLIRLYFDDNTKKVKESIAFIEKIEFTDEYEEMYDLEVEDNHNFILENNILTHNSGKTFLLRRFVDTIVQAGNTAVYLLDCKGEMGTSVRPVQKQFQHLLMENEKPTPTKVVTLRPTFFKQLCPENMTDKEREQEITEDNYWYSIDINKLSRGDFFDLVKASAMGEAQQSVMEELYKQIRKYVEDGNEFSFAVLMEMIDALEDINDTQKNSLKRRLKPLVSSYFYEPNCQGNIIELIKDGFVPAFNLEDFDRFGDTGFQYHICFLSIVHRELVDAKRKNLIGKLWITIDEAGRVLGVDSPNNFQSDIIQSVELNTRYDVNYFFLTQFLKSLPERIIKNSRYIMVPASADLQTFKDCFMELGLTRNIQSSTNDAIYFKKRMSIKMHEWLILDRMTGSKDVIRIFAPLSEHKMTGH